MDEQLKRKTNHYISYEWGASPVEGYVVENTIARNCGRKVGYTCEGKTDCRCGEAIQPSKTQALAEARDRSRATQFSENTEWYWAAAIAIAIIVGLALRW